MTPAEPLVLYESEPSAVFEGGFSNTRPTCSGNRDVRRLAPRDGTVFRALCEEPRLAVLRGPHPPPLQFWQWVAWSRLAEDYVVADDPLVESSGMVVRIIRWDPSTYPENYDFQAAYAASSQDRAAERAERLRREWYAHNHGALISLRMRRLRHESLATRAERLRVTVEQLEEYERLQRFFREKEREAVRREKAERAATAARETALLESQHAAERAAEKNESNSAELRVNALRDTGDLRVYL